MIVLDTNVISEAMKPEANRAVRAWLNEQVAETLYLTSVTLAELLLAIAVVTAGRRGTPWACSSCSAIACCRSTQRLHAITQRSLSQRVMPGADFRRRMDTSLQSPPRWLHGRITRYLALQGRRVAGCQSMAKLTRRRSQILY
jgi:PIN domain